MSAPALPFGRARLAPVVAAVLTLTFFLLLAHRAEAAPSCVPAAHANCAGVDLSGMDLHGRDLQGINLKAANLKAANLDGANGVQTQCA